MDQAVFDEVMQKAEWRARLVAAVVHRKFDDETLVALLEAGLHYAHSEGLRDAAEICDQVGEARPHVRHVADVLSVAMRKLIAKNDDGFRNASGQLGDVK